MSVVVWHDVECHGYSADLPVWRELAAREAGPVLDVGAGTGRVALDLAAAGHTVVALDLEPALLTALGERAGQRGLTVETVVADAERFALGRRFGLILVPMQTVQLLADRPAFLRRAREHLAPGGLLAAAVADDLVAFEPDGGVLPAPDVGEVAGHRYVSQPVAVRLGGGVARIERLRIVETGDGDRAAEPDAIELAQLDGPALEREAVAAGLRPEPSLRIDATPDHVGSVVVMLRG